MFLPKFTFLYKTPINAIVYSNLKDMSPYGFLTSDAFSYYTYTLNCPAVLFC